MEHPWVDTKAPTSDDLFFLSFSHKSFAVSSWPSADFFLALYTWDHA
jgi:hypothetical protein